MISKLHSNMKSILRTVTIWYLLFGFSNATNTNIRHNENNYNSITESQKGIQKSDDRDLQLDVILNGLSFLCGIVGALLPGDASCDCGPSFSDGIGIEAQCAWTEPICVALFCAAPQITAILNIFGLATTVEFCYYDASIAGTPLPSFCINIGAIVIPNEVEDGSNSTTTTNPMSVIGSCSAEIGGQTCNVCTPCEGGTGITFDCTNLNSNIKQSECSSIQLPTFAQPPINNTNTEKQISILPSLDS